MKLSRRVIGDPILRKNSLNLEDVEIPSEITKKLVTEITDFLREKNYGIAIAAPQVGVDKSIVVIDIKKTPTRPDAEPFHLVMYNPEIISYDGDEVELRDGCISIGDVDDPLYGWSTRYTKVIVRYKDQEANELTEVFEGFIAHVMQHEIDHLNGILFVDRVKDSKKYTHASEYKKTL